MYNDNRRCGETNPWRPLAVLLLATTTASGAWAHGWHGSHHGPPPPPPPPIVLQDSGGFIIGGQHKVIDPAAPNRTLSCDHGYVEYFHPLKPRETSLVLWHSSSTQVWQNRWDGGPGYKDMMLRANYPTYLWDGPRVGRANWSCEEIDYKPAARDQGNFTAWNFGPTTPTGLVPLPSDFYPDSQFPKDSPNLEEYWWNATGARYDEFDHEKNIEIETDAAAVAADSGKLGNQIVYLTNSAGGLRAMRTTTKATKDNIAGIVTYESIGYVFPIGDPDSPANLCTDPNASNCGFGPIGVTQDEFKKLARLHIQFVWGDHRGPNDFAFVYPFVEQSRLCAKLINKYAADNGLPGHAEVLMLGDDAGLKGSSHIAFADIDNDKVAALLFKFLHKSGLDRYAGHHHGW